MTKPLRVGLLGLGQRGLQHLKALWQLQEEGVSQIVALGDAFPDNLEEAKIQSYVPGFRAEGIHLTSDFETLLKPDGRPLDALYIAIPPNIHQGEVIHAAEAGIHLFVEKPMSLFLDEALAMNQAIRQAGLLSTVGFQQRFEGRSEAVAHFLADKLVVMAHYAMHAPLEAHNIKHTKTDALGGPTNRVWTANRAWSGMTVVEGGIHPLDLWRYWFGDVVWVQANYVHRPPEAVFEGADNPYAYAATFGFANGAIGNMTLSRLRRVFHSQSEHLVLWDEGHLRFEGAEVATYHYDGPYPPADRPTEATLRHTLPTEAKDSTYAIAQTFLQAIAENKPELIRSPFADAMNSLTAVIAANVSDELGGEKVVLADLLTDARYTRFRQKSL